MTTPGRQARLACGVDRLDGYVQDLKQARQEE